MTPSLYFPSKFGHSSDPTYVVLFGSSSSPSSSISRSNFSLSPSRTLVSVDDTDYSRKSVNSSPPPNSLNPEPFWLDLRCTSDPPSSLFPRQGRRDEGIVKDIVSYTDTQSGRSLTRGPPLDSHDRWRPTYTVTHYISGHFVSCRSPILCPLVYDLDDDGYNYVYCYGKPLVRFHRNGRSRLQRKSYYCWQTFTSYTSRYKIRIETWTKTS